MERLTRKLILVVVLACGINSAFGGDICLDLNYVRDGLAAGEVAFKKIIGNPDFQPRHKTIHSFIHPYVMVLNDAINAYIDCCEKLEGKLAGYKKKLGYFDKAKSKALKNVATFWENKFKNEVFLNVIEGGEFIRDKLQTLAYSVRYWDTIYPQIRADWEDTETNAKRELGPAMCLPQFEQEFDQQARAALGK